MIIALLTCSGEYGITRNIPTISFLVLSNANYQPNDISMGYDVTAKSQATNVGSTHVSVNLGFYEAAVQSKRRATIGVGGL